MDGEIGSLILHARGAQCTAPHKREDCVSSGTEDTWVATPVAAEATGHVADFN